MSKDRDGRVSQAQMKKLLDLLNNNKFVQNGRVDYKSINKVKFWKRIAVHLNNIDNGAIKDCDKWCKVWCDWKNKTKKKADIILKGKFGTQTPNFSILELRLLKLMSYPVADLMRILSEKKFQPIKPLEENGISVEVCPIDSDFSENKTDAFHEDNREFISVNDGEFEDSTHHKTDNSEKFTLGSVNIKEEADKDSDDSDSFEDFKTEVQNEVDKEKLHHKSEELKLKALELKLKADELKLQEAEVNRVNYLTQLEEQKLKVMTDIAASLKELVECTRNGSTRFHNVM